ncbi:leukemia inhibitory factor-like [Orycteropus afer afer]|uniref:Leukemia inhibitory factor n=1 Tax=Orycteropus afer afer TaxID=1230840 RepID=A0A8B7AW16_ORYAF|nr:leukemia inhibitory factor-like [Orycteropus afer afer]
MASRGRACAAAGYWPLAAPYHSQGEPFASMVDVLCNHDLMDFPSFHADGKRKNKLVELYHIFSYLGSSLGNILQYQRTLNPSDQNLHSKLSSSVGTMRGILSNVFCHLCNKYHVGHMDVAPVSDTSAMSTFENKRLGCRLLGKYKQVITELAQAF